MQQRLHNSNIWRIDLVEDDGTRADECGVLEMSILPGEHGLSLEGLRPRGVPPMGHAARQSRVCANRRSRRGPWTSVSRQALRYPLEWGGRLNNTCYRVETAPMPMRRESMQANRLAFMPPLLRHLES